MQRRTGWEAGTVLDSGVTGECNRLLSMRTTTIWMLLQLPELQPAKGFVGGGRGRASFGARRCHIALPVLAGELKAATLTPVRRPSGEPGCLGARRIS